jgi:hypothetical protein
MTITTLLELVADIDAEVERLDAQAATCKRLAASLREYRETVMAPDPRVAEVRVAHDRADNSPLSLVKQGVARAYRLTHGDADAVFAGGVLPPRLVTMRRCAIGALMHCGLTAAATARAMRVDGATVRDAMGRLAGNPGVRALAEEIGLAAREGREWQETADND